MALGKENNMQLQHKEEYKGYMIEKRIYYNPDRYPPKTLTVHCYGVQTYTATVDYGPMSIKSWFDISVKQMKERIDALEKFKEDFIKMSPEFKQINKSCTKQ